MAVVQRLLQFVLGTGGPKPRVAPRAWFGVESLEARECLSFGAVPPSTLPSGGDRFTVNSFGRDGNYVDNDRISRGEVDSTRFVAQRSGNYTFEGKSLNSSIDTVIALYDSSGRRLAYNDDASSSTNNSKFTFSLVAGRTYTIAISNYNNTSNGAYTLRVTAATLTTFASQPLGRTYASGDASLSGTTLTLNLFGQTKDLGYYSDHFIRVRILDRNGKSIHTSSYQNGFRTDEIPFNSTPNSRSRSWTFSVSNLDLSRASRLEITVGQS